MQDNTSDLADTLFTYAPAKPAKKQTMPERAKAAGMSLKAFREHEAARMRELCRMPLPATAWEGAGNMDLNSRW